MISYRTLKKLVGETSLERKCRLLFGVALMLLITGSFWWYASRTKQLVENQQILAARMMVPRNLQVQHYTRFLERATQAEQDDSEQQQDSQIPATAPPIQNQNVLQLPDGSPAASSLTDMDLLRRVMGSLPAESNSPTWDLRPVDELGANPAEFEAVQQFSSDIDPANEYFLIREEDGRRQLQYYAAIRIEKACLACHRSDGTVPEIVTEDQLQSINALNASFTPPGEESATSSDPPDDPLMQQVINNPDTQKPAPLFAIASILISLDDVEVQLTRNWAVLFATGIVTAFLAMLAGWAIVRYIIVKPVQHLKDVSDEIARGNLNLRADISTGDEFEELSHAFNRMLRHMMTVNDEFRTLNVRLDAKVDQLAQANLELFNSNRLKDDFLATISHELRTPLNSILGFSDILQTASNLDDRQRRYVDNIQSSGQALMIQINDLLDLAKIESGKMEINAVQFDLRELLELQVQQMLPLADRRSIDLRLDAIPPTLPVLFQDNGKIRQILSNLLSNAIKFTPEGGRVRVTAGPDTPDYFVIRVEDNGIGIPLHEQKDIFEKFRQGSTAPGERDHTRREYGGTGLGLSIVRELSRLLGGDVHLKSEFGRGSLFSVRLPCEAPNRLTPATAEEQLPIAPAPPLITSATLRSQLAAEKKPAPPRRKLDIQTIGDP